MVQLKRALVQLKRALVQLKPEIKLHHGCFRKKTKNLKLFCKNSEIVLVCTVKLFCSFLLKTSQSSYLGLNW